MVPDQKVALASSVWEMKKLAIINNVVKPMSF